MRKTFSWRKVLILVLALVTVLSVTTPALADGYQWFGNHADGSASTGTATGGYSIIFGTAGKCVIGYRFALINQNGCYVNSTTNNVKDVFLNDFSSYIDSYYRGLAIGYDYPFSRSMYYYEDTQVDEDPDWERTEVATSTDDLNTTLESSCGFGTSLPSGDVDYASEFAKWSAIEENAKAISTLLGSTYAAVKDNKWTITVEPIFGFTVNKVHVAWTVADLAAWGKVYFGGKVVPTGGDGTFGYIANKTNKDFPNLIYVSDSSVLGYWSSTATALSSKANFDTLYDRAYGIGVLVANGSPVSGGGTTTPTNPTYTITYDPNGGTLSGSSTQSYTKTTNVTLQGEAKKTGYTFTGWKPNYNVSNSWDSTKKYAAGTNCGTGNYGDVTMVAQWTPNNSSSGYTLTLIGDVGVESFTSDTGQYTGFDSGAKPNCTVVLKPGYRLVNITGTAYNGNGTWNETDNGRLPTTSTYHTNFTMRANRTLYAITEPITHTNGIAHWAWGFRGSGNNSDKSAFKLTDTYFSAATGSSILYDSSKATTIPNGFYLSNTFGSNSFASSWTHYSMGTTLTQPGYAAWVEYDYEPYTYRITYNLNGGTNNSANPSTYNVLFGVTFGEPSKAGYSFVGWYINGTKVTGINPGANASFSSVDDLYSKLASRTTGDVTVEARWRANYCDYTINYYLQNVGGVGYYLDSTATGTAAYGSSLTGPVKSYTGFNSPAAQTITIGTSGNVINYYYTRISYTLDLNGWLDGAASGGIAGYGTADVYINGALAANDATDYCTAWPYGTTFEIKDIRANTGKTYNGVYSGSITGTITGDTSVVLSYSTNYYYLDLNGWLDGASSGNIAGYGTADVYINGTLVANDATDYCVQWPYGTTYEIKDIRTNAGKTYNGVHSGSLSGTLTGNTGVELSYSTNYYYLDLNGWLDGASSGNIAGYGTADVYINGTLVANDATDYCIQWPYGTTYEIKDIRANTGKSYNGVYSGSITGTITGNTAVVLNYSTITYTITYDSNGGSAVSKQTYNIETNVTLAGTPTKTGYKFTGWKLATATGNWAAGTYTASQKIGTGKYGNITLVAQWTPISYTITYDSNGGSTVSKQTYNIETNVTLAATPTKTGYTFTGWKLATATGNWAAGTYTASQKIGTGKYGNITLVAQWQINTYTNIIQHWALGFVNGEGNNTSNNAFHLGKTSWKKEYGGTNTYSASDAITIPNGFYLGSTFYSSSYATGGSWTSYPMGTSFTQPAKDTSVDYYYHPYTYNITYNLNGGTNNNANPSTYNVLYGVTFGEPSKVGYSFVGWYINGVQVSGINPGANASFSSVDDMYSKLASRTTGDVTVEARWKVNYYDYAINYYLQNVTGNGYTLDSTATGTAAYGSSLTGPVKSYTGFISPDAQTITISTSGNGYPIQ